MALVCKQFQAVAFDSSLWKKIFVSEKALDSTAILSALACNPRLLSASYCCISGPLALPQSWIPDRTFFRLRALSLAYSDVDDDVFIFMLKAAPNIAFLDLAGTRLTDRSMEAIAEYCPSLSFLSLRMASQVTEDGICALLRACTCLDVVNLSWTATGSRTANTIAYALPNIHQLDMSGSGDTLHDEDMHFLTQSCQNLTVVEVSDCYLLSDGTINAFVQNCPNLVAVSMSRCHSITMSSLLRLVTKPNLKQVNMYGCVPEVCAHVQQICRPVIFNKNPFSLVEVSLTKCVLQSGDSPLNIVAMDFTA